MTFVGFLQYVSLIVHIPTCAIKYWFFVSLGCCLIDIYLLMAETSPRFLRPNMHVACIDIGRDDHLILRLQFLEIICPQRSNENSELLTWLTSPNFDHSKMCPTPH